MTTEAPVVEQSAGLTAGSRALPLKVLGLTEDDLTFEAGELCISKGVAKAVDNEDLKSKELKALFLRHVSGDWGEGDKTENDAGRASGGRIMSIYTIREIQVWIITELGGAHTTMLFPDEY